MKKTLFVIGLAFFLLALPARAQITLLHEFAGGAGDGDDPNGPLLVSGSTFYGMTCLGGSNNRGMVFKMQSDGSGFTVLHNFDWVAGDGNAPMGSLVLSGSTLFGMTRFGGASNTGPGAVFKVNTDGTGFALLHSFVGGAADGGYPWGDLLLYGSTLFGTTSSGGDYNSGTVFKINTDGTGFALLHEFNQYPDGTSPNGSLILSGSTLYGMAPYGGSGSNKGTVFKLQVDGSGFTVLHSFAGGGADGAIPWGSLVLADGYLYGMTSEGGDLNHGTVFKVKTDGTGFSLLHEFAGGTSDGRRPLASLTLSGSTLCGMTTAGGDVDYAGTVFQLQTDGSGYVLLHEFAGGAADGDLPQGDVIISGSTLYGVTARGGDSNKGVVFSLPVTVDPSLTLTSPSGGEAWTVGESRDVTWTSGGAVGNVHIDYSTDNGVSWISMATNEANDGVFSWTVPDAPSALCLVRIYETDGAPLDASNSLFTILPPPSIAVTSPNGGEVWTAGESRDVTWTSGGAVGDVHIDYSADNGVSWTSVATNEANDGNFSWTVPNAPSALCLVRVYEADGAPLDASDSVFTILPPPFILLTSPSGGEEWTAGTAHDVTWTSGGAVGNVHIDYSMNSGGSWTSVATNEANDGVFSWTVPNAPSALCFVRVYEADGAPLDASDSAFTILPPPSITVTSPNGGEEWTAGTAHDITWTSAGITGGVDILYTFDGGANWTSVAANTDNDGSYSWTVPETPAANCYVQVLDHADGTPNDGSDAAFTIVASPAETVSTPTTPTGPANGDIGASYSYETGGSTSSMGHDVQYLLDWGDGTDSGWLAVGTTTAAHAWALAGSYNVKAMARCASDTAIVSSWSGSHLVEINDIYVFDGHDFNGSGGSDVSVYRPTNNFWHIRGVGSYQWGSSGDKPVSGDYDHDGKTDIAIFRPTAGKWIIKRSTTGTALNVFWGAGGDIPVPGDYDGDDISDAAVWRPSTGKWMIKGSAGANTTLLWGAGGDVPVPGDYDGDGKADRATFRATAGKWYVKGSAGTNATYTWGASGDIAVPADYDGDGKDDAAVFRPSAGKWFIKGSAGTNYTYIWGQNGDTATPGDFDNDGKADVAIFRPAAGKWMIKGSAGSNYTYFWGTGGDVALVK